MTLLVEGFDGDAIALAGLLAAEGHPTTLAAPGAAPPDALALRSSGVEVREHVDLDVDLDAGEHDEAFLDVWTPEVAPRVARLRASGCRVRCLADLVLERTSMPTIGITGTAGKTTTAAFLVELLRKSGRRVAASTIARAGNLWPTAELLDVPDADVVVLELTSSHLCFTTHSPTVAVVTSFWPDHLELHGSLERYRAAKEAIVRGQSATDAAVVNADDEDAVAIGSLSPGRRLEFSQSREVEEGAFLHGTALVLRTPDGERELSLPPGLDHPRVGALLGALAAMVAVRSSPKAIGQLPQPPFRMAMVGRLGDTELVDDGMSATPTKTVAALRPRRAGSVVLVAGGELESAGLPVHASPPEQRLLEDACAEARRAARLVVVFGPAAERLAPLLGPDRTLVATDLQDAIARAGAHLGGAEALLVSPMFPLPLAARASIVGLLQALAERPGIGRTRSSLLA